MIYMTSGASVAKSKLTIRGDFAKAHRAKWVCSSYRVIFPFPIWRVPRSTHAPGPAIDWY
jgi:hypothetical protein